MSQLYGLDFLRVSGSGDTTTMVSPVTGEIVKWSPGSECLWIKLDDRDPVYGDVFLTLCHFATVTKTSGRVTVGECLGTRRGIHLSLATRPDDKSATPIPFTGRYHIEGRNLCLDGTPNQTFGDPPSATGLQYKSIPSSNTRSCPQTCRSDQYRAEYWNNNSLSGSPSLVRCESWPIDQNWGTGSPGPGIPSDGFSARWTGRAQIVAGSYDFIARGDDGIRAWLDNDLIIDRWSGALPETRVNRQVSAGQYDVKVEFREFGGDAIAKFRWEPAPVCPSPRVMCNGVCCAALATCVNNVCTLPPDCNKALSRESAPSGTGMAGTTQCYLGTQCQQTISVNLNGAPANTGYDVYIDWGGGFGTASTHKFAGTFTTNGSGNAIFQNTIQVTASDCPARVDNEIVPHSVNRDTWDDHQFIQQEFAPCAYCPSARDARAVRPVHPSGASDSRKKRHKGQRERRRRTRP